MPVKNLNAFRRRMKEVAKLPERTLGLLVQSAGKAAFGGIIEQTPVDAGELRAGWFATLGSPSGATPASQRKRVLAAKRAGTSITPQPTDQEIIDRAVAVIAGAPAYGQIWFTNNTPYADVIETGGFKPKNPGPSKDPRPGREGQILVQGGYSTQAPAGMLRNGLLRAAAELRRANQAQRGVIGGAA